MHTRSTQYPYSGRLLRVAQAILSSAVPGPATLLLNGTGQHAAFDYADQPPRPDLQGAGLTIMAWVRPRAARIGWASLASLPPAACVHGSLSACLWLFSYLLACMGPCPACLHGSPSARLLLSHPAACLHGFLCALPSCPPVRLGGVDQATCRPAAHLPPPTSPPHRRHRRHLLSVPLVHSYTLLQRPPQSQHHTGQDGWRGRSAAVVCRH